MAEMGPPPPKKKAAPPPKQTVRSKTAALKKPGEKLPYHEQLAQHLAKHNVLGEDGGEPLPQEIRDMYTLEEKEEAFFSFATKNPAEQLANAGDAERERVVKVIENQLNTRANGANSNGNQSGYQVADMGLDSEEPDADLTTIDGSQELLNPLSELTDEEFLKLDKEYDPMMFLLIMDPHMNPKLWIPEPLKMKLTTLYQSRHGYTMDEWKAHLLDGYVARYAEVCRQYGDRIQLSYFVRKDLYLLLVLEQKSGPNAKLIAHFYAWSMHRSQNLLGLR
jgi:hypothetical protein